MGGRVTVGQFFSMLWQTVVNIWHAILNIKLETIGYIIAGLFAFVAFVIALNLITHGLQYLLIRVKNAIRK